MLIKREIDNYFLIKGKLHIPDVLGIRASRELGAGEKIVCVIHDLNGNEFEVNAKVAFELINYKGRADNLESIGGSIVIDNPPESKSFKGWTLFVSTVNVGE